MVQLYRKRSMERAGKVVYIFRLSYIFWSNLTNLLIVANHDKPKNAKTPAERKAKQQADAREKQAKIQRRVGKHFYFYSWTQGAILLVSE